MNEQNKYSGPPHPMAGKIALTGYSGLAHRLGVPRSTAIRMVERGQIQVFSEGTNRMVVSEKDVESVALQIAIEAEIAFNRAQDRNRIARTLADPDRATDNDLIYALARTSGKEHAELYWHFGNRKQSGRPFINEKFEKEVTALESAKAKFPRKVRRFNAKEGRTEEHLVAPLPQGQTPEE